MPTHDFVALPHFASTGCTAFARRATRNHLLQSSPCAKRQHSGHTASYCPFSFLNACSVLQCTAPYRTPVTTACSCTQLAADLTPTPHVVLVSITLCCCRLSSSAALRATRQLGSKDTRRHVGCSSSGMQQGQQQPRRVPRPPQHICLC
jgi:hypothetical protein